jgi:hypothetical protein
MMRVVPLILAAMLVFAATPAHSAPLAGIVTGIVAAVKGSTVLTAIFKIIGSVVLSKLAASLQKKPRQPGIKTDVTQTGSTAPCSFILGEYATDGVHVCPPMTHGTYNGIPNAFMNYVIELGDVPGQQLLSLIVDGEPVEFGPATDPVYGYTVTAGKYAGAIHVLYYDGTQTVASPLLMSKYSAAPERPWSADMVGRGICYAVVTFRYDRAVFNGFPTVRFVMRGIPLYDPRKDDTVGGVGLHRWADRSTWEWSANPIVQLYNAHRGIAVAGHHWGGRDTAASLPIDWWFAAMNAADLAVDDGVGGTEPQFRAGAEVFVSEEPASVAEELLKASLAQVADMGGRWLVAVADAGLPVYSLIDDDLIASQSGDVSYFPAPQETFNAISGNYPFPDMQWQANAAPMLTNPGWELEDGRRLPVSVDYQSVPYPAQVQRLMAATIAAERRFLTHSEVLPPEAMALDLLDAITWSSVEYGYDDKLFQIGRIIEDLQTGLVTLHLRERDPADVAVVPGYFTAPEVVSGVGSVTAGPVAGFVFGPADPISATLAITDADTGWVNYLSTTIFDQQMPSNQNEFSGLIEATLTGTTDPRPLLWRLRFAWLGGSLYVTTRSDLLYPGETHLLTAAGYSVTGGSLVNMRLEVSGRGLSAGETITLTKGHFRAVIRNR